MDDREGDKVKVGAEVEELKTSYKQQASISGV